MTCFIVVTVLWVFSVCLHEFGHALTAYYGGDHTVKEKGYLTMNPLRYTHPVMSILLPVLFVVMGGIGLPGGAVYIERHLLRSKAWETGVSLAGPAMNVTLCFLIGAAFQFNLIPNDPHNLLSVSLGLLLQLQVTVVILNLLPIPPLDGFQAIAPWLPVQMRERLYGISNQGLFFVFLALWMIRPVNQAFWNLVDRLTGLLGVAPWTVDMGWHLFRFWER